MHSFHMNSKIVLAGDHFAALRTFVRRHGAALTIETPVRRLVVSVDCPLVAECHVTDLALDAERVCLKEQRIRG